MGQSVSVPLLEKMTLKLAHRGPDDFGFVFFDQQRRGHVWKQAAPPNLEGYVGLGNRRLKIIDLSPAGHQPMSNVDRTLWVTFNGEIFNYVELRAELAAKGYSFASLTDTEVILNAYAEWDVECFKRFNGMWALAIYDSRDGSLVLSRDRWGIKPLYVHLTKERLVFGSEVKTLLCHPEVPRRPNYRTIYDYVARHYRWVDGGYDTFFEGIHHLPPAHYWKVRPDGSVADGCYWALDPTHSTHTDSEEEVLACFRELFEDAVRIRLRSDVPVACMLSGGLDSASITSMAAHITNSPITTFSARYTEQEFDEGYYINATVGHVKADGHYIYPKPGELIDTLGTMLAVHDEPVCTVTWYAHWMVMKEVANLGFPVLLNGHVGDELFAGYWDHYLYNFADLERDDPALFKAEFDHWLANHERDTQEYKRLKVKLAALESGDIIDADSWADYADVVNEDIRATFSNPPHRQDPFAQRGYLTSRLYRELIYETVPATLRPEDRNSMAFSIETRSPFLDYRLAEFAFSISNRYKIRNGLGKWIVREGMKGILPEVVRNRRDKQGFNAPTVRWFRGENRETVREILASKSLVEHGILNQTEVLRYFDEHVTGQANHDMAIWQWLNLELWMRQASESISSPTGI